jgi:ribonucleoside-diphosphate reductase alpha chain
MSKGYFSLSSPIWANFGLNRGLPISCFGSYVDDSIVGIIDATAEVGVMSKSGGGTSAYMGHIRPRGSVITNNGYTNGSFSFVPLFDTMVDVVSQGTSRKGQCAVYIDIEHPDIHEWLNIHTEGNPIQLIYYGVSVGKEWLNEMKEGDEEKRALWAKVLQRRSETGIPYLFFKDNVNANKPEVYKDEQIYASNLCTEIMLPSNKDESFVCCLSSMNVLFYEEWKNTDVVQILTYFLDAVMEEFIKKGSKVKYLERAVTFAKNHRALGIGVLGWHSYLQNNKIAFESFQAMQKNAEIFSFMKKETYKASQDLYKTLGAPEKYPNLDRRNTTLMSIAPTKSSSYILGQVSPSIEPYKSNYYIKDLAKIKEPFRNPYLKALLKEKKKNTDEVWDSILAKDGSVQHLSFLSEEEKSIFKTFREISQLSIIQQAAQRQKFIDQGQSVNLMIHPNTPLKLYKTSTYNRTKLNSITPIFTHLFLNKLFKLFKFFYCICVNLTFLFW